MMKVESTLRERYIRWFHNATQAGCENFEQPMTMDLRRTLVEVEICTKSKQAKIRRHVTFLTITLVSMIENIPV